MELITLGSEIRWQVFGHISPWDLNNYYFRAICMPVWDLELYVTGRCVSGIKLNRQVCEGAICWWESTPLPRPHTHIFSSLPFYRRNKCDHPYFYDSHVTQWEVKGELPPKQKVHPIIN